MSIPNGEHGERLVPMAGLVWQTVDPNDDDVKSRLDNASAIAMKADAVLQKIADNLNVDGPKPIQHIGIIPYKLDGRIRQISWSVGPDGASTTVSENGEHSMEIPPEPERRALEKRRQLATDGFALPADMMTRDEALRKWLTPESSQVGT
jgi:hypothetical protein